MHKLQLYDMRPPPQKKTPNIDRLRCNLAVYLCARVAYYSVTISSLCIRTLLTLYSLLWLNLYFVKMLSLDLGTLSILHLWSNLCKKE